MEQLMNSRERIFTALERKEPDRVPILEWSIDSNVMDVIYPECSYFDFLDRIGMDAVSLGFGHTLSGQKDDPRPGYQFKDKWGVTRVYTGEAIAYPIEGIINSEADLKSFNPPDPKDPELFRTFSELVQRFKGNKAIIWENRDAFSNPRYLRGTENIFMDYLINPKFAHEITEMALAYEIEVVKHAVNAGAEIVMFGDDYAYNSGPLISPNHFKEFVLPGLKKLVDIVHELGAYCVKHTDGNIMKIIDMIIETGIDGINPIDPIAGMDIQQIKKMYGNQVCIIGNIDCGSLLTFGTPEQVTQAVKKCISVAAPGGGYILSSSNSIHSQVKPENFLAMVEATKRFGAYD
jgi:uroporphyrinogen decarboxylase